MKRIDRTGQKNGKLTVTGDAPSKGGHSYCFCSCECGRKDIEVAVSNLTRTLSCGCGKEDYLQVEKWSEIIMGHYGYFMPYVFIPKSQRADRNIGRNGYWLGRCLNCHTWVAATSSQLRAGQVMGCTLCGNQAREQKIMGELIWLGDAVRNTDTRNTFYATRHRCAHLTHKRYGGRGIKVCDRWLEPKGQGYRNFVRDMGLRPHRRFTLERVDGDGDYTPENCIWADDDTQRRNKSTSRTYLIHGEKMNQVDLAVLLGTSDKALSRSVETYRRDLLTPEQINERLSVRLHTVQTQNHN
jgi:hypothetical protein